MPDKSIEENVHMQMKEFLPYVLAHALENYTKLVEDNQRKEDGTADVKALKTHQDACKVAIAHIELLTKLIMTTQNVTSNEAGDPVQKALENIFGAAKSDTEHFQAVDNSGDSVETCSEEG
jgi:hypothetical protein